MLWIGGATWGDFDRESYKHKLVTPGGMISKTGVAGLTLGGETRFDNELDFNGLHSIDVIDIYLINAFD